MTAAAISADRTDQVPLLYEFAVEAGQIPAPKVPPSGATPEPQPATVPFPAQDLADQQIALSEVRDWNAVTQVGEGYIDKQCNAFIAALNDLERTKRTTLANLNALQAATVGIMGLALAAQKAIGIVAISFGLAASLFDTTTSTVLYQLPASGISSIVEAQRQYLRLNEAPALANITNQGLAAARLNEYVRYCVPVTIEANIAKVLGNTKGAADGIVTATTQPVVVPAFVRTLAFKDSRAMRADLKQQIDLLDPNQVRALATRMQPDLTTAGASLQRAVNAVDPNGRRFTDPVVARQVLDIWVIYQDDPTTLKTWSDSIKAVQGG